MARTVTTISQNIKSDFVANPTLNEAYGLDPSKTFDEQFSSVSVEGILIYTIALAMYFLERIMDSFSDEVNERISNAYLCSIPWFCQKVLDYQHGYELAFIEKSYSFGYSTDDPAAKIIKYVAVREKQETITKLKVYINKANHAPLTELQLNSFKVYMKQVGPAGIHYEFINRDPDWLKLTIQVIYDPLVINTSGQKITDNTYPVREAIDAFVDGIQFGGTLNRTKLVDAIQATPGVVDVILIEIQHKWDPNIAFDVVEGQNIESASGSFIVNELTDTYTPNL